MTVSSMTGFARVSGTEAGYSWVWEAKSVNARGLDVRFRLPPGLDHIEAAARAAAGEIFRRGNLAINLTLTRAEERPQIRVNRDVLDQMIALVAELRGGDAVPDIETLLTLRGVVELAEDVEADEEAVERRDASIAASLEDLLGDLSKRRAEEGARLRDVVIAHLDEIAALTEQAAGLAEMQPERRAGRLREQLDELFEGDLPVAEERLAQEIALIVARGDVREELDRLVAHVDAARDLIDEAIAIGRRLDFLCQEFNREANTLCSKSSDLELTRIGLALKAAIERLREQVQNIE